MNRTNPHRLYWPRTATYWELLAKLQEPSTVKELAAVLFTSDAVVYRMLRALIETGYVERCDVDGSAYTYRVKEES